MRGGKTLLASLAFLGLSYNLHGQEGRQFNSVQRDTVDYRITTSQYRADNVELQRTITNHNSDWSLRDSTAVFFDIKDVPIDTLGNTIPVLSELIKRTYKGDTITTSHLFSTTENYYLDSLSETETRADGFKRITTEKYRLLKPKAYFAGRIVKFSKEEIYPRGDETLLFWSIKNSEGKRWNGSEELFMVDGEMRAKYYQTSDDKDDFHEYVGSVYYSPNKDTLRSAEFHIDSNNDNHRDLYGKNLVLGRDESTIYHVFDTLWNTTTGNIVEISEEKPRKYQARKTLFDSLERKDKIIVQDRNRLEEHQFSYQGSDENYAKRISLYYDGPDLKYHAKIVIDSIEQKVDSIYRDPRSLKIRSESHYDMKTTELTTKKYHYTSQPFKGSIYTPLVKTISEVYKGNELILRDEQHNYYDTEQKPQEMVVIRDENGDGRIDKYERYTYQDGKPKRILNLRGKNARLHLNNITKQGLK